MPSKGTPITVDGYGTGLFAGALNLDNPEEASVLLKFEGGELDEGYGRGIIEVPYQYYKKNKVPSHSSKQISTEKREAEFERRD